MTAFAGTALRGLSRALIPLLVGHTAFTAAVGPGQRRRQRQLETVLEPNPFEADFALTDIARDQEALSNLIEGEELRSLSIPSFQSRSLESLQEQQIVSELERLLSNDELSQIAQVSFRQPPSVLQIAARAGLF